MFVNIQIRNISYSKILLFKILTLIPNSDIILTSAFEYYSTKLLKTATWLFCLVALKFKDTESASVVNFHYSIE